MSGSHSHVKDVWIPLNIREKTKNPHQRDCLNHIELLKQLSDNDNPHVVVVKGDPGAGKTTLVKKIAYDWATDQINQFSLILAIPLRYATRTADFLHLTVDYYADQFRLLPSDKIELLNWLSQLNRELLICLDGLDEIKRLAESPFRTLFAAPFESSEKIVSLSPAPYVPYHLLITSRPYACELINFEFCPLHVEISSLDQSHLEKFVCLYC